MNQETDRIMRTNKTESQQSIHMYDHWTAFAFTWLFYWLFISLFTRVRVGYFKNQKNMYWLLNSEPSFAKWPGEASLSMVYVISL